MQCFPHTDPAVLEVDVFDEDLLAGAQRLDAMPYYLSRTGEPLKVVCHIRDEAHRFGITFHRQKRSKGFIHSELENIEGVGPKTIELLLRHFRTVEKIRTAPAEELSALIGPAKAARLLVHFGRQ